MNSYLHQPDSLPNRLRIILPVLSLILCLNTGFGNDLSKAYNSYHSFIRSIEDASEIQSTCRTENGISGKGSEFLNTTYYRDADGDGFGNPNVSIVSATPPTGYVANNGDCDDNNSLINPNATEVCDALDNDCDGQTDEGVTLTFYADADGDSFGNANITATGCYPATGFLYDNSDCNDANAAVNPNATEVCNGIDDDCDSNTDANDGDLTVISWYPDADGDGFGNANAAVTLSGCPVAGFVTNNTDCDDGSASVSPNATEGCDAIDNDCDGQTDEGVTLTFYADADRDGFGNAVVTSTGCYPPSGFIYDNSDCNDTNASVNPNAAEVCNGIDDDCDGNTDASDGDLNVINWYPDADGDGFGNANAAATLSGCPVAGFVTNNTDCDDGSASVSPNATEVCDAIDNDCDGQIDEGVTLSFYADADGDGFGDAAVTATGCYPPVGFVYDNSDCNDANATMNPDATEVCNGIDDDCDGNTDASDGDLTVISWYPDADGDGFGDANAAAMLSGCPVAGAVIDNSDCDDGSSAANPGASEIPDGIDNNCDGSIDESSSAATLHIKLLIEGFHDGNGGMIPVLANNLIPDAQPTDVDTVTIELRDPVTTTNSLFSATGVLNTAGQLTLNIPSSLITGSYYIVVIHRNAVQTWSALPVSISSTTIFDFTTASTQAFGANQHEVIPGVFAFFSGDLTPQDGVVDIFDQVQMDNEISQFAGGYITAELNGDGVVDLFDQVILDNNIASFIGSAQPF